MAPSPEESGAHSLPARISPQGRGRQSPQLPAQDPLPSARVPQSWGRGGEQAWGRGQCSVQVNPIPHQLVLSREAADHTGSLRCGARDVGLRSPRPVAPEPCSHPGLVEARPRLSLQLCAPSLWGTAGCGAAALPLRAALRLQHCQSHWGQTRACSPQHTTCPQHSLGRLAAQGIWEGAEVKSLCTRLAEGKASCRLAALPPAPPHPLRG